MMKKIMFLLLNLFVISCAYCDNTQHKANGIDKVITHENRYEKLIELAQSYIVTNPEFAFNCAHKAHKIAIQTKNIKQSMQSNIILGDIFYDNGAHLGAITYYENAINEMFLLNNFELAYKIYIKIAYIYNDYGIDESLCLESIKKAIECACKCKNKNAVVEANLALSDIYFQQGDYSSSLSSINTILENNVDKYDSDYITQALTNKAKVFIKFKKYNEAMSLIDSSLNMCDSNTDEIYRMINYSHKAEVYDSLANFKEAKKYYTKAIMSAYEQKEYEKCGNYMYNLGMLEKKRDSINSAINIFRILSDSTETFKWFNICYKSYFQLSDCYAELDDYKNAYILFNKFDIIYDSATNNYRNEKAKKIYNVYNLSTNAEEMKLKEFEDINSKKNKIGLTIVSVVTVVVSIILIALVIIHSRNKIIYHKNQETVYEQEMKIKEMESELIEIQLKKNKELLMNLAFHFKSYIEFIAPIKKELKEILDSTEIDKNKIKNIYSTMQNNSFLFNIESLNSQINDIYKDFLDRLEEKYPNLTKSEKRLCAMLYINMSSKEIATITNTTLRSVETSRYRLRKKFELTRDEDMINFLKKRIK